MFQADSFFGVPLSLNWLKLRYSIVLLEWLILQRWIGKLSFSVFIDNVFLPVFITSLAGVLLPCQQVQVSSDQMLTGFSSPLRRTSPIPTCLVRWVSSLLDTRCPGLKITLIYEEVTQKEGLHFFEYVRKFLFFSFSTTLDISCHCHC